jgi:hypothetical protein
MSWSAPVLVDTPGEFVTNGALDFPWLSLSPIDRRAWVTYQVVTPAGASFEKLVRRSSDGGFTPSVELDDGTRPSAYRDLAVHVFDPAGSLYAAWMEMNDNATQFGGTIGGSTRNEIRFARIDPASDGGVARAGPDVKVSSATDAVAFEGPAVALSPDGGTVYVAWIAGTHNATCVRVAVSTDRGASFSMPTSVSDNGGCATQFHESLAVDDSGRVLAFWYDNRDGLGHLLYAASTDSAATFGPPRLVGAPSFLFDTVQYSTDWLGDYFQPAVAGGKLYLLWSDNREGGQSHAFFAKAPLR